MRNRREISCSSFALDYENPSAFTSSKWQRNKFKVSACYLIYRGVICLICLIALITGITVSDTRFWFIYLSNLGFLGLNLHLVLSFVVLLEKLFLEREGNFTGSMTFMVKASWLSHNVVTLTSFVISVCYWIGLYDPNVVTQLDLHKFRNRGLSVPSIFVHGFNSFVTVTDIFVSARPCRILHFYQSSVVVLCYVVFTVVYWAVGGINCDGYRYIYPNLDWDKPALTLALVVVGLFVIVPLLQGFVFGLHCLRDLIHDKLRQDEKLARKGVSTGCDNMALEVTDQ